MLHYIIQILFFQLFFLLVYEIFLKKETFFNYNRIYLLLTPILAFVIPWLRLEFLVEAVPADARILIPQAITEQPGIYRENLPLVIIQGEKGLQLNWWLISYFLGFSVSLYLFIKKYRSLNRLFNFRQVTREKDFRIIEVPDSNAACTFFSTVFIGDQLSDTEKQHILSHELVHVRHKHSLDLIFFELLKVVFWFNPLIYIYQSRIAGLHEFIADEEVVKTIEKRTYYEQLLNTAFSTQNISFINQFFNHSLIKKRIFMLQKNKSSQLSKFKFLLVIPLMLAMLTYVACSEEQPENLNLSEYSYSLSKGEGKFDMNKHTEYEEFLLKNPEYVSWATVGENEIKYTIHPKEEAVPSGYRKLEVGFPNGDSYLMFMNLDPNSKENKSPEDMKPINIDHDFDSKDKIPFALIDQVPTFSECQNIASREDQKTCVSNKISKFVNLNFNTNLGKELGLTGVNRVIVQFRIDETGNIVDVKARAPHKELEKEAKRVISSLPQMEPGIHQGRKVSVMYSLPIAFKVGE